MRLNSRYHAGLDRSRTYVAVKGRVADPRVKRTTEALHCGRARCWGGGSNPPPQTQDESRGDHEGTGEAIIYVIS